MDVSIGEGKAAGDVKRILITGMSGTGKSSVILALAALGYPALDMDEPGCSEVGPDGDWVWVEERASAFLAGSEGPARLISSARRSSSTRRRGCSMPAASAPWGWTNWCAKPA